MWENGELRAAKSHRYSTAELTRRDNDPDEVHEEIVEPEVESLWSAVCDISVVMVEGVGCIVEDQSIHLANADDDLERVSKRVRGRNKYRNHEADWSPGEL